MTTTKLSDKQLNFAYVALACVDIIKLPLIDILRSSIEPQDLREAVQKCNPLMKGRFRLRPEQKAKCGFTSPNQSPKTPTPPPNYNDFDVTLVSALIQNLCSQFQPPTSQQSTNKQLWEEIKEVRRIKNNCLSHIGSGQLDKTTFDDIWNSMENVIKRIQTLTKSNTNRLKELDDLKHKTVKSTEYESLIEKLKEENRKMKESVVPWNVKEQMETDITDWKVADNEFVETHSFPQMLNKVQSKPYITFVGAPGSGKTATARHIALKLQEEEGYDILPIKDIKDIITYCDPNYQQVFVIDDLLGVFGLNTEALSVLDMYKENIRKPKMSKTRILMTCRAIVFRNDLVSTSFLKEEENTISLHSEENELTDQDKYNLLKIYGLKENILTTEDLATTSNMFPFLCKLFSKKQEFKAYGSKFFKSPIPCLLKELDRMQIRNKMHYCSLVLLMANQNKLSKHMFDPEKHGQTFSFELKRDLLSCCKVPSSTDCLQFFDALKEMVGTYTKKQCVDCDWSCDCKFTFLHESMFEITAYHFGKLFPELILKCMSSNYVANKIRINQQGLDDTLYERQNKSNVDVIDLCIELSESKNHLLAERLWRDVVNGELHKVFGNEVLKHVSMVRVFIELMKEKDYNELHSVFLSKLTKTSEVVIFDLIYMHNKKNSTKLTLEPSNVYTTILKLLNYEITDEKIAGGKGKNVRAISWVVYSGHHQILEYIIERIIKEKGNVKDLFQTSYNKNQSHTDSCQGGTVTKKEGSVDSGTEEESRLLCLGCISGDLDTVKMLLQHVGKEAINNRTLKHQCRDDWETMPLAIACYFGYQNIIKKLITEGANVNVMFHDGTPLTYAIKRGDLKAIDELIEAGADVNLGTTKIRYPLNIACETGNLNIVKKLLNAGSSSELTGPLTVACRRGHFDVVRELIKYGVDVNKVDNLETPLIAACSSRHLSVIKLLLEEGAEKTEIPNVNFKGNTDVFLKMIALGIDVTKNDLYKTSLIAACAKGQFNLAEQMINTGVDVNLKDGLKTPLIVACYFGHLNVVEVLIKAKVNVNLGNGFITPLQVACYDGNLSIVSILIRAGAHVNRNYKDGTALAAACFFRHVDVVKALIEAGADVNQKSHGERPIEISKNFGDTVSKELIKAGAIVHPMLALLISSQ